MIIPYNEIYYKFYVFDITTRYSVFFFFYILPSATLHQNFMVANSKLIKKNLNKVIVIQHF